MEGGVKMPSAYELDQFKIVICRLLHMDLMVTTNQKPIIDTQMKKRKESKHNTKDIKS